MQNDKEQKKLDIIYPKTLGNVLPEALLLCEIFINSLIKATKKEIYCKANTKLGYIESDVAEIKSSLALILKTRQIEAFYNQFIRLLHGSDNGANLKCLGRLELIDDQFLLNFYIQEEEKFPDFKWKIVKVEKYF